MQERNKEITIVYINLSKDLQAIDTASYDFTVGEIHKEISDFHKMKWHNILIGLDPFIDTIILKRLQCHYTYRSFRITHICLPDTSIDDCLQTEITKIQNKFAYEKITVDQADDWIHLSERLGKYYHLFPVFIGDNQFYRSEKYWIGYRNYPHEIIDYEGKERAYWFKPRFPKFTY